MSYHPNNAGEAQGAQVFIIVFWTGIGMFLKYPLSKLSSNTIPGLIIFVCLIAFCLGYYFKRTSSNYFESADGSSQGSMSCQSEGGLDDMVEERREVPTFIHADNDLSASVLRHAENSPKQERSRGEEYVASSNTDLGVESSNV